MDRKITTEVAALTLLNTLTPPLLRGYQLVYVTRNGEKLRAVSSHLDYSR